MIFIHVYTAGFDLFSLYGYRVKTRWFIKYRYPHTFSQTTFDILFFNESRIARMKYSYIPTTVLEMDFSIPYKCIYFSCAMFTSTVASVDHLLNSTYVHIRSDYVRAIRPSVNCFNHARTLDSSVFDEPLHVHIFMFDVCLSSTYWPKIILVFYTLYVHLQKYTHVSTG